VVTTGTCDGVSVGEALAWITGRSLGDRDGMRITLLGDALGMGLGRDEGKSIGASDGPAEIHPTGADDGRIDG